MLAPAVQSPALSPSFLLGHANPSIVRTYFGDVEMLSVGVYTLSHGAVTSHGLILHEGRPLFANQISINKDSVAEAALYGAVLTGQPPSRWIDGEAVSLVGPGHLIYGHWLVDFLPKLFVLDRLGMRLESLKLLLPANTPSFALEWLRLLGVCEAQILPYSPYKEIVGVERLLIPTMARTSGRAHPLFGEAVRWMLDRLRSRGRLREAGSGPQRLYVQRPPSRTESRALTNRSIIEAMAVASGFTLVRPELLPIVEQVALFAGAVQIAGEYGSGLHSSMFSAPGTFVCAFRGNAIHPGFLQSGLCQALGQKIGYVFGEVAANGPRQDFTVPEEDAHRTWQLLAIEAATAPLQNSPGQMDIALRLTVADRDFARERAVLLESSLAQSADRVQALATRSRSLESSLTAAFEELQATRLQSAETSRCLTETDARCLTAERLAVEAIDSRDRILQSTIWKISYPLRKMLSGAPAIRTLFRRAAKSVWYAVTLRPGRILAGARRLKIDTPQALSLSKSKTDAPTQDF